MRDELFERQVGCEDSVPADGHFHKHSSGYFSRRIPSPCIRFQCWYEHQSKWSQHFRNILPTIFCTFDVTKHWNTLKTLPENDEHMKNPFEHSSSDPGDIVLAIYNTIYAFSGW